MTLPKKKIVIIVICVVLVGIFVVSPVVSYFTDPEYRKALEKLSEPQRGSPDYEDSLTQYWADNLVECLHIKDLEELKDFTETVNIEMETLLHEVETYVKSESAVRKITNSLDGITECVDTKKKEFGVSYPSLTNTLKPKRCDLFCDYTGYEPDWVTDKIGQNRAMSICLNIGNDYDNLGSKDWNWCNELSGHIMDSIQ